MSHFKYSCLDFLLSSLGLPLFLFDIVLDVLAAVDFYQEASYVRLGVLLLLLIGSSVLAQLFSWFWYKYEEFQMHTTVEKHLKPVIKSLHVFQLGIYARHAGVFETSLKNFSKSSSSSERKCCSLRSCFSKSSRISPGSDTEDYVVFLSHDLAMLRIIEAFSESAPQIVLMLTVILQKGQMDYFTVLKTVGSVSAVAFCVTMYHRCLRSFLPEKKKQNIVSSVIFFFWNLLLVFSRIVALSLFASVLPCFIFTHFFCSWLVLFFFAWRVKTDFMDCSFGEWLYRATVGLIWYFDWFNVMEGNTRNRTLLYHSYILADISILCGVWYWKMSTDPPPPPFLEISQPHATITATSVVGVYIFGLFFKIIYYKFFHPNVQKDELKGGNEEMLQSNEEDPISDEVDLPEFATVDMESHQMRMMRTSKINTNDVTDRCLPSQSERCNKRMRRLAENFYS